MKQEFVREGWRLSCIAPAAGKLAAGVYNAGSGLADDTAVETDEYSILQICTDTEKADFDAYIEALRHEGYTQIAENTLAENHYAEFEREGRVYHIAYIASARELRVEEDRCGTPLNQFACNQTGDRQTVLYQYGLYYDPQNRDNTGKTINCGMLYIVRLSDRSVLLVDGGHLYQSSDEAIDGLWTFLREITDTPADGVLRIKAWYITHAHGDHVTGVAKLLKRYRKQIALERVMYNFPSYQVRSGGYDSYTTVAKEIVRTYYPDVRYLKLHSGQAFTLSDLHLEVLFTHEDAVKGAEFARAAEEGRAVRFPLRDYNCTSAILRLTIDGQTVLLLGDTNVEAEAALREVFSEDVWKSDAVQVAHHCFNYLDTLYPMIAAPIALMPNSYFGSHTPENLPKLATVLKFVENGQIYYEGEGTVGLAVADGKLQVICKAPVVGGEYDFSGIG